MGDAKSRPWQTGAARIFQARAIGTAAVGVLILLACGCRTASYYTQAIGGQWEISSGQRPIAEVICEQPPESSLSGQLELVQEIIAFAGSELGLPTEGAYQDYVDLQRPYVVWNVLAAPEFSLEARTWWYPLVGSLEYRGYFEKDRAVREGDRLKQKGDDVFVGGVAAYSTLGWFDDPVLNTFVDDSEPKLAELLFHELAHRRLFLSGDTAYSEALAMAVGREGVRRWFLSKGDAAAMENFRLQRNRDDQVIALILTKRDELEILYLDVNERSAEEMRSRKAAVIKSLRSDFTQLKQRWPGYRGFEKFMAGPINNARLNAVDTYYEMVPKFERLLAQVSPEGDDFRAFFELLESTRRMSKEERRDFLDR